MHAKRSPTFDEFRLYAQQLPSGLPLERLGEYSVHHLLAYAEVARKGEVSRSSTLVEARLISRGWQNASGFLITWALTNTRRSGLSPPSTHKTAKLARRTLDMAFHWGLLEQTIGSVPLGHMAFGSDQVHVEFTYVEDVRYEVLQVQLEPIWSVPKEPSRKDDVELLSNWMKQKLGSRPYRIPAPVMGVIRDLSEKEVSSHWGELPSDTRLGTFTIADARRMWTHVHSLATLTDITSRMSGKFTDTILIIDRQLLTQKLADEAGTSMDAAADLIELLIFLPGYHPDPALAPFVLTGKDLVISPTLVLESNFERNLIRVLALDPSRYGRLGKIRGAIGTSKVADFFRAVPGTKVTTNRKVRAYDGSYVGDLDVLAVDSATGNGVAVEVKWPAPADSIKEVRNLEAELDKGIFVQMQRIKSSLVQGLGTIDLPPDWPPIEPSRWQWLLVCKGYTSPTPKIIASEIEQVQFELLPLLRKGGLLEIIEDIARKEYLPVQGRDFSVKKDRTNLGEYRVQFEYLDIDSINELVEGPRGQMTESTGATRSALKREPEDELGPRTGDRREPARRTRRPQPGA